MSTYLANVEHAARKMANLDLSHGDEVMGFLDFSTSIYEFSTHVNIAMFHHDRKTIRAAAAPAIERLAHVPLYRRCQVWPRGFPGDYETIELMLGGDSTHSPDELVRHTERFFRLSPPVQQHRNKVVHQASLMLQTWSRYGADARILVVACGGCPDVRLILPVIAKNPPHMVLVDFDEKALTFARQQLSAIDNSCHFVKANVARSPGLLGSERFHLVVTGGLFDYLPDEIAVSLLRQLYTQNLLDEGTLLFTNYSDYNPFRPWMQCLINWVLIERSYSCLMSLCTGAGIRQETVNIFKEATALTYLVEIGQAR